MPRALLQKSLRNEVFQSIENAGLDTGNFHWTEVVSSRSPDLIVSRLVHASSESYFLFDMRQGDIYCEFAPSSYRPIGQYQTVNWNEVRQHLHTWVDALHTEVREPDLWQKIREFHFVDGDRLNHDRSNEPFTEAEVLQIITVVASIKDYAKSELGAENPSLEEVNRRLDYLIDSAQRLGRFDWWNAAFGVVTSLAISAIFAPEQAKHLWTMLVDSLRGLVQLPF